MINSKSGNVADARKQFDALKASKVRCLPEFWDRFNAMEKKLLDWEKPVEPPKSNKYTVVKGDCLYKIAAKKRNLQQRQKCGQYYGMLTKQLL